MGYSEEEAQEKQHEGLTGGESGVTVENTELLSDGEQMPGCHCACIFYQTLAWGGAPSMGTFWQSEICIFFSSCHSSWHQIDFNFKTRPTGIR